MTSDGRDFPIMVSGSLHARVEAAIFDAAATYDPEVLADTALSIFLSLVTLQRLRLGAPVAEGLPKAAELDSQIAAFKRLLESVRQNRSKRPIITT